MLYFFTDILLLLGDRKQTISSKYRSAWVDMVNELGKTSSLFPFVDVNLVADFFQQLTLGALTPPQISPLFDQDARRESNVAGLSSPLELGGGCLS